MKLNKDRPNNNNNNNHIFLNGRDFYHGHLHHVGANQDRKEFTLLSSERLSPSSTSSTGSSPSSRSSNGSNFIGIVAGGCNYIQHRVSKMDTLAGIAIMYGVEVTDIKRMNGFMTDRQMFALKSILIPMPGKYSPSSTLSKCLDDQSLDRSSEETPAACHRYSDLFRSSFQSSKLNSLSPDQEVSPAMTILQNFYGLTPPSSEERSIIHKQESSECSLEDTQPCSNQYLTPQRRSKSIDYNLCENGKLSDEDIAVTSDSKTTIQLSDRLLRRRQASVADFGPLKEDCSNSNSSGEYSAIMGTRGLALRSKAASRIEPPSDHGCRTNCNAVISLGSYSSADVLYSDQVRKSCSLSSFHDEDNNSSSSSSTWSTSQNSS